MTSIPRWEGEVREATEARAFLRSRLAVVDAITRYVVERHPYDVPNVTAVAIVGGNPRCLAWIADSQSAAPELGTQPTRGLTRGGATC